MTTTATQTNASAATTAQSLYLIEFYTNEPNGRGGFKHDSAWDINFAWVFAADRKAAKAKLAANQGARFCEVILCDEQAEITKLAGNFRVNTPDANLFIIR
jgi:hypothetical protein